MVEGWYFEDVGKFRCPSPFYVFMFLNGHWRNSYLYIIGDSILSISITLRQDFRFIIFKIEIRNSCGYAVSSLYDAFYWAVGTGVGAEGAILANQLLFIFQLRGGAQIIIPLPPPNFQTFLRPCIMLQNIAFINIPSLFKPYLRSSSSVFVLQFKDVLSTMYLRLHLTNFLNVDVFKKF